MCICGTIDGPERKTYCRWSRFSYSRHHLFLREISNPYYLIFENIFKRLLGFHWKITIPCCLSMCITQLWCSKFISEYPSWFRIRVWYFNIYMFLPLVSITMGTKFVRPCTCYSWLSRKSYFISNIVTLTVHCMKYTRTRVFTVLNIREYGFSLHEIYENTGFHRYSPVYS